METLAVVLSLEYKHHWVYCKGTLFFLSCKEIPEAVVSVIRGLLLESHANFSGPEKTTILFAIHLFWRAHVFNVRKTKRIVRFDGFEPWHCKDIKGMSPLQLTNLVMQNRLTGEQMTHWDMVNKATKLNFFPYLNSFQCVICSPVRRFLYLVIAHLQRAHCSTRNRPEKLWDFWETGPRTLKSVVKGVSGMASGFLAYLLKSSE